MDKKTVKIKVSPTAWSESEKSWFILSYQSNVSWRIGFWYPKNICNYKNGIIEMPKWYYDRIFAGRTIKPEIIES
jgi:hypothetical protein